MNQEDSDDLERLLSDGLAHPVEDEKAVLNGLRSRLRSVEARRSRQTGRWWWLQTVAAGLLVAATGLFLWQPWRDLDGSKQVAGEKDGEKVAEKPSADDELKLVLKGPLANRTPVSFEKTESTFVEPLSVEVRDEKDCTRLRVSFRFKGPKDLANGMRVEVLRVHEKKTLEYKRVCADGRFLSDLPFLAKAKPDSLNSVAVFDLAPGVREDLSRLVVCFSRIRFPGSPSVNSLTQADWQRAIPLIADLDEEEFEVRDAARRKLPDMGEPLLPYLEMLVLALAELPDGSLNLQYQLRTITKKIANLWTVAGLSKKGFSHRIGEARRRLVVRGGGSKATEAFVNGTLHWLARHQEADGHWDAVKYGAVHKTDTACTGLALLAFLGAGHTENVGQYKDNVGRAVAWLKSRQDANGLIFDNTDAGGHRGVGYPHAICGIALAEAAGMGDVADTKAAAQRAIDYTTKVHQQGTVNDKRGFRYRAKMAGDLSVTGWYVTQLTCAVLAGLDVDEESFKGALKFIDSVEKKGQGGDGKASVYWYQPNNAHAHTSHRLTAIGNLCRQFRGWKKEDLQSSVSWFVDKGGVPDGWGEGKTDLYYWYFGTLCVFQQGGDLWKRWNEAMKKTLCESQRRGGDEDGSWDPVGPYSKEWGRVGQTALAALCLEVYYRYLPRYRTEDP